MANKTGTRVIHGTLVASTVDTITFTENYRSVEVLNVDGASAIYAIVGSTVQPPKDPTVAMTDSDVLPATIGSVEVPSPESGNTVIKLISAGTPAYSVRGLI